MAEEQKFDIPLTSGLSLTTDDMIIPAQAPQFHFNDQIVEANIMANHFKYEGAGHIADHYRYLFESNYEGDIETNWPQGRITRLGRVWAVSDEFGVVVTFTWGTNISTVVGTVNSFVRNGDVYDIRITTLRGFVLNLKVNPYDLSLISIDSNDYNVNINRNNETQFGLNISRKADESDILKYRPAQLLQSELTLLPQGMTSNGLLTRFLFPQGYIELNGDSYTGASLRHLTISPSGLPPSALGDIIVSCVSGERSPIAIALTHEIRVWAINEAATISANLNLEDNDGVPPSVRLQLQPFEFSSLPALGEAEVRQSFRRRTTDDNRPISDIREDSISFAPGTPAGNDWFKVDGQLSEWNGVAPNPWYSNLISANKSATAATRPGIAKITMDAIFDIWCNLSYGNPGPTRFSQTRNIKVEYTDNRMWTAGAVPAAVLAGSTIANRTGLPSWASIAQNGTTVGTNWITGNPPAWGGAGTSSSRSVVFNGLQSTVITPNISQDDKVLPTINITRKYRWTITVTHSTTVPTTITNPSPPPPTIPNPAYVAPPANDTYIVECEVTHADNRTWTPGAFPAHTAADATIIGNTLSALAISNGAALYAAGYWENRRYRNASTFWRWRDNWVWVQTEAPQDPKQSEQDNGPNSWLITSTFIPFAKETIVVVIGESLVHNKWRVELETNTSGPWPMNGYSIAMKEAPNVSLARYRIALIEAWAGKESAVVENINVDFMQRVSRIPVVTSLATEGAGLNREYDVWMTAATLTPAASGAVITDITDGVPLNQRYKQSFRLAIAKNDTTVAFNITLDNRLWADNRPGAFSITPDTGNPTGWQMDVVRGINTPPSFSSPVSVSITAFDNTPYFVALRNHKIAGEGRIAGVTIDSMTTDARFTQTVNCKLAGADIALQGAGVNYTVLDGTWSLSSMTRPDALGFLNFTLALRDTLIADIDMIGMITRREDTYSFLRREVSGGVTQYIWATPNGTFFVKAGANAQLKLVMRVNDILKNRSTVDIPIHDLETSSALFEDINYHDFPRLAENMIDDANDNQHSYYALNKNSYMEITRSVVKLIKRNETTQEPRIVQSRMFREMFVEPSGQRIARIAVSSSLQNRPYIYVFCDNINDDTFFTIYHTEVRLDDLNYGTLGEGSWLSTRVNLRKNVNNQPPATDAITYYTVAQSASQLIRAAVISSTRVGNELRLGIKLQRGMSQWTIKTSGGAPTVVTGFGSVGPDGLLTGNWIPKRCCSITGFNGSAREGGLTHSTDAIHNVSGAIFFNFNQTVGYVYAITGNGSLLSHDELSSNLWWEQANGSQRAAAIPVAANVKVGPFSIPGAVAIFYGVNAYAGYWHSGSTWLTGARNGDIIWAPWREQKAKVHILPDFVAEFMMALAGVSSEILQPDVDSIHAAQEAAGEQAPIPEPTVEITPARMTQAQADMIKNRLATGARGSHSSADIARYAAEAGVTDTGIIEAIQQGSWNSRNGPVNMTWRQGIDAMVEEDVVTIIPAEMPVAAPSAGAEQMETKQPVSRIAQIKSTSMASKTMEITAKAELHSDDSIIPCCFNGQRVYSGPGYYSVQIYRANRRKTNYQQASINSCAGFGINVAALVTNFLPPIPIPFVGTVTLPKLPWGVPMDYGTTPENNAENENIEWQGGAHVYFNGPLDHRNTAQFDEILNTCDVRDHKEKWEPAVTWSLEKKIWDWKSTRKAVSLTALGGIIIGNRSAIDTDGMTRGSAPVFTDAMLHDACIDAEFQLYCTFTGDDVVHVSVDDTKIIDGGFTNVIKDSGEMLVGSLYNVVRIKRSLDAADLRPYSVLQGLVLNKTGANWVQGKELIHAFDGYGSRISSWVGAQGSDIEELISVSQYLPFRESIPLHTQYPPSAVMGKFISLPVIKYQHGINIVAKENRIIEIGTNMDTRVYRFSIPVFFRRAADYPTGIKTIATYKLHVVDGRTSLTTDGRTGFARSLSNASDVMIYGNVFRAFDEYLSQVQQSFGMVAFKDSALKVGYDVIGSDTKKILFFNTKTRQLMIFTGSETLEKVGTTWRVKKFERAVYEFLRQELVSMADLQYPQRERALIRFDNLKPVGMIPIPPHFTDIDRYASAAGYVYQGLDRTQAVFDIFNDHMLDINLGVNRRGSHWDAVPGDDISDFFRDRNYTGKRLIDGYYWEPFKLATGYLGLNDSTDCQFEWVITFAFTEWMHKVLQDKWVTVNIAAETAMPNGHRKSEVTHLRLKNDMFQRSNERIGYYSFRFNARNGAGNSERLLIWSDGIMALRNIELIVRPVTSARTSPMLTQADFNAVDEF